MQEKLHSSDNIGLFFGLFKQPFSQLVKNYAQNIFSIKKTKDFKHKVITFFGIKFKIKRKFPTLSIITICYNEPQLERTLKSIVNQSYQDFEWIVVDGGSDKPTQDIFDKYKYRIDKFISEKDSGIYNAMNKGIKLAEGEYLLFLNAGDHFYSNDILQLILDKKLDKDIVYSNCLFVGDKKVHTKICPSKITPDFIIKSSLPHPCTFIKKNLFKKYGLYNENYKIVSDWEKWIVFLYKNKASSKYINLICSTFYLNGLSGAKEYRDIQMRERKDVINKYFSKKTIDRVYNGDYVNCGNSKQLISIKETVNKKHKILNIAGICIKFKNNHN